MAVTIHDVAKRLNLSITTVSRALDGYDDVAKETAELVKRTAAEMGYVPNRAARQLRRRRSDTIGYILPASGPQFADPFFSEFIAGLGDEAASQNYDLLVSTASPDQPDEPQIYKRWVSSRKVDGFVLNRVRRFDWRVQFLSQSGIPFTSLEQSEDAVDQACVQVDNVGSFRAMVQHLLELGHRRIAYIGGWSELKIQIDRFAGYREALEQAGLALAPHLLAEGDLTPAGGYQAARALLMGPPAQRPTAITCINDLTATGVLHAAHELGLSIGKDLAVAGFDGIADSAYTEPPLTTINQPVYDIARQLVKMLLIQIHGEELTEKRVMLQPELILRASTIADREYQPRADT